MAKLNGEDVIEEFEDFSIRVEDGSPILDKLLDIGHMFGFAAEMLCNEWIAFASQNNSCQLEPDSLCLWEGHLHASSRNKSALAKGVVPRGSRSMEKFGVNVTATFSEKNLDDLFSHNDDDDEGEDDLFGTYGTQQSRKKAVSGTKCTDVTTPTTPSGQTPKSRHFNGSNTPLSSHLASTNGSTPSRTMAENGILTGTPSVSYQQRKNSGQMTCSLNEMHLPDKWLGSSAELHVQHYSADNALKSPYQFMFQKVSEKALIILERIEKMGVAICNQNRLSSPLSVAQPSLEPAVFTGQVVCEGEGHLNARSCLLQSPSHSRRNQGACVHIEIPDNITCSLFPGQIVAVEGTNNYNGMLLPSRIYDEGVIPPLPKRMPGSIQGFTMLCAAGPYTTIDNLNFEPLHDLLAVVRDEKPDLLLLLGPFLESAHPQVKNCDIPGDQSLEVFFEKNILNLICRTVKTTKSKLVLIPSQFDAHHPYMVYPQPPFQFQPGSERLRDSCFSDPATLDVNGLCIGLTSTDILFHLSARTMFKGCTGDRMARLSRHILQQLCYYPLMPAFQRDSSNVKPLPHTPSTTIPQPTQGALDSEVGEVNLDLIHMFDHKYAVLPARPDLLVLPSSLKPFAKRLDGCVCVNPGRLTKKTSGGTFIKIIIKDQCQTKEDFSSDIGVKIVHI